MSCHQRLLITAFLTGFVGDAILQTLVHNNLLDRGLRGYFNQHGSFESLFIAGGMIAAFYALYISLKLPLNYIGLALYGIILDLIFRKFRLFHSLDGYYESFSYFSSGLWGAIPMILPLFIDQALNKITK